MSEPARPACTGSATSVRRLLIAAAGLLLAGTPAAARDALGVFGGWAAFRDVKPVARCYAVAEPVYSHGDPSTRRWRPYATISHWPSRGVRGQLHLVLSRPQAPNRALSIRVGGKRFPLVASGALAWAPDARTDAAIVAAMRQANSMDVSGQTPDGKRVRDIYELKGAPTAIDAATLGCLNRR